MAAVLFEQGSDPNHAEIFTSSSPPPLLILPFAVPPWPPASMGLPCAVAVAEFSEVQVHISLPTPLGLAAADSASHHCNLDADLASPKYMTDEDTE